jgi:hypothetical protein
MKRFYVILLSVFILSAVLLGLSYSKDAGEYGVSDLGQIIDDKYRVIFSTSDYLDYKNLSTDVGIVNKTEGDLNYIIKLIPEVGKNIQYSVNGSELKLLEEKNVYSNKLNPYGQDGDFALNNITIKCDGNCRVKVEVKTNEKDFLLDEIKNSKNVYDDNGVLRYYGQDVNNYISFNGTVSRVVKLENNQVYLISNPDTVGAYKVDGSDYLLLNDYLRSFKTEEVLESEIGTNKSWLMESEVYWLESDGRYISASKEVGVLVDSTLDVHYIRSINSIDVNNLVISKGDGSISNPYEVSYGS